MKRILIASTASLPILLAVAAPAKAFVPIVLAGIIAGSVLFGAVTGSVVTSQHSYAPTPAYSDPTPAPACVYERHYGKLVKTCY